ncbi:hypothetical protein ACMX2H_15665 [Arthrobacter sulfonylureivorans]|uniref:hypothetical protein n=1 Tax=Arthrobacter sulfonylureivorans TaxID=2486855 RepID=UPI0039E5E16C
MEGPNPRAVALWLAAAVVTLFAVSLTVMPSIMGLDVMPALIVVSVLLLVAAGVLAGMAIAAKRSGRR